MQSCVHIGIGIACNTPSHLHLYLHLSMLVHRFYGHVCPADAAIRNLFQSITKVSHFHFIHLVHTQSSGQVPGDGDTGAQQLPKRRTDTLVLYHNGHEAHWLGAKASDPLCVRAANGTVHPSEMTPAEIAQCWMNYDTVLGWVNELGYYVRTPSYIYRLKKNQQQRR